MTTVLIELLIPFLIILALFALVFGLILFGLRRWIRVASPDEALVISGRKQTIDGETSPVTVVVNGRALINPITQRAETISLRSRQVSLQAEAQSEDNVTLQVEGVAIVKIGSSPTLVRRAAERFASQDSAIEHFTTEQLEGALRGVVATLSVEVLMRDRKKFSDQIATDVSAELEEQGLILDSFQIKGITDAVGYIQSLGVPQIQAKRREAEIAQTNAERAITQRQIATDEENLVEQTRLDQNRANAEAEVGKAQAEAEQAEALARAQAQQRVLEQEALNRQAQLDAEVRRTAEADRYRREQDAEAKAYEQTKAAEARAYEQIKDAEAKASIIERQAEARLFEAEKDAEARRFQAEKEAEGIRLKASANAEAIEAEGRARAEALRQEADALSYNQQALLAVRALETLPSLMSSFAEGYSNVGEVTLIGGADSSMAEHFNGEQSTALASTFATVKAATGIDMGALIQGRIEGAAMGRAIGEELSAHTKDATPAAE
ncbi:flotillin family protein [Schaalia sp. Marseille-Q2122]|uniref:flotillin family protein n=1 Tax=Schaalia sp. Marseille-Q2122 TaxID=2736604 RepID=UPI00158CAF71|nr:SPFH domain-containing protein [Schaalia sp. Marseille-Q2122]